MSPDPAARLAAALRQRGLAVPARLVADAHRPLGPLLADVGAGLGPLARLLGGERGAATARLLEDPEAIDRFLAAIDAGEGADAEPG